MGCPGSVGEGTSARAGGVIETTWELEQLTKLLNCFLFQYQLRGFDPVSDLQGANFLPGDLQGVDLAMLCCFLAHFKRRFGLLHLVLQRWMTIRFPRPGRNKSPTFLLR